MSDSNVAEQVGTDGSALPSATVSTPVNPTFPGVQPAAPAVTDQDTLNRGIAEQRFNDAVQAAVAEAMRAHQNRDLVEYDAPDGPRYHARDAITEEYYGGMVSRDLVDACDKARSGVVLAVQRSIRKDKFGATENVWFPAPVIDGVAAPIPGEHRKVFVEQEASS